MLNLLKRENSLKKKRGFTLIEVVAAAALIGTMVTMVTPAIGGANNKVKNAKLANDLAAIDQAIQMYRFDHDGALPDNLDALNITYLGGSFDFKDAKGTVMTISNKADDGSYAVSGKNAEGETVYSKASKIPTT